MPKRKVLNILESSDSFVSGEKISKMLGITRAAVWKNIKALRQEGYTISSKTNRGYKLEGVPDRLDTEKIKERIIGPMAELFFIDSVDSTNNALKLMAQESAAEGTVLISEHQKAGRGRFGRSFASPRNKGIYMSILLQPESIGDIAGLTCMTAVAVCRAVEKHSDVKPQIKWTNDLLVDGKKLCGILTELSAEGESGEIRFVIIGIGINVNHERDDFPQELRDMATSLYMSGGKTVDRNLLAAEVIDSVLNMYREMKSSRTRYMDEYRRRCITLGKTVEFIRDNRLIRAFAERVEDDGVLVVRLDSGEHMSIRFGEVSVAASDD